MRERVGGKSDHDRDVFVVYTITIDRWLQKMGVLFEPRLHVLTAEMLEEHGLFGIILVDLEVIGRLFCGWQM